MIVKKSHITDILGLGLNDAGVAKDFWMKIGNTVIADPKKPVAYKKYLPVEISEKSPFWNKVEIRIKNNPNHISSFSEHLKSENIDLQEVTHELANFTNSKIDWNFVNDHCYLIDDDNPWGKSKKGNRQGI